MHTIHTEKKSFLKFVRVKRILHIWIINSTKLEKKDTENPQSMKIYTKKSQVVIMQEISGCKKGYNTQ